MKIVKTLKPFSLFVFLFAFIVLVYLFQTVITKDDQLVGEAPAEIYQPAPTPGTELDLIETDAEITIPDRAREIHAMISGFRDIDTWVRFDIPNEDPSSFLDHTCCEKPLVLTDPKKYVPTKIDPSWWEPHQATYLEECTGGHNTLFQQILVDRTNPQVVRIYVKSIVDVYVTSTPRP